MFGELTTFGTAGLVMAFVGPVLFAGFCGTKKAGLIPRKTKILMWIFIGLGSLMDILKILL